MNIPIYQLQSIFNSVKHKESRNTHRKKATKREALLLSPLIDKSSRNSPFSKKVEENLEITLPAHKKIPTNAVIIVKSSVKKEKVVKMEEENPKKHNATDDSLYDFIKISFN